MDAWVWWLVAAAVTGIVPVATGRRRLGLLAAAALPSAAIAGLGSGPTGQIVVFTATAFALLTVVGPLLADREDPRTATDTGRASDADTTSPAHRQAVVLEQVGHAGGRIRLAGQVRWTRPLQDDQVFEAGQEADVVRIDGTTALIV